jgi:hypothetical protein
MSIFTAENNSHLTFPRLFQPTPHLATLIVISFALATEENVSNQPPICKRHAIAMVLQEREMQCRLWYRQGVGNAEQSPQR